MAMSAVNVKYLRDNVFRKHYPNKGIVIRLDNNFTVDERNDYVHWDDSKEILFWACANADEESSQGSRPITLNASQYEEIQQMWIHMTNEENVDVLKAAGYTDDQIKKIVGSLTFTVEDFADSVSNQVKGRKHDVII